MTVTIDAGETSHCGLVHLPAIARAAAQWRTAATGLVRTGR